MLRSIYIYNAHTFGGAKELGIVYVNIVRGAKEPRNLQNYRGVYIYIYMYMYTNKLPQAVAEEETDEAEEAAFGRLGFRVQGLSRGLGFR